MYLYNNIESEHGINVEHLHYRKQIISKVKQRFLTYGYKNISTSTFETYDLYARMNGTVNHREMIKTIDNTGQVLVLRPDVTIPLTQQLAQNKATLANELRYSYTLDVFRQETETNAYEESTQAGVEFFGNSSPEADAEIIALAVHLFKDLEVPKFTIELGNAGFFKTLIANIDLSTTELAELEAFIQAKNIPEIEAFLQAHSLGDDLNEIIASLPFLYGNAETILQKAAELPLSADLQETVGNMSDTYDILQAYGVHENVVIDFSLINHMDYYSGIIFQGFVEKIGKPVLMGGRYDKLANQFNAEIPAIGFACNIDLLLDAADKTSLAPVPIIDIAIVYEKSQQAKVLPLATELRNERFSLITLLDEVTNKQEVKYTLFVKETTCELHYDNKRETVELSDIVHLLCKMEERN